MDVVGALVGIDRLLIYRAAWTRDVAGQRNTREAATARLCALAASRGRGALGREALSNDVANVSADYPKSLFILAAMRLL